MALFDMRLLDSDTTPTAGGQQRHFPLSFFCGFGIPREHGLFLHLGQTFILGGNFFILLQRRMEPGCEGMNGEFYVELEAQVGFFFCFEAEVHFRKEEL